MRVAQVMTPKVEACRPEDSLARAAQLMWDVDCGCIPVCAGDGDPLTIGVITDRDICMCALFRGEPLAQLTVGEAIKHQKLRACEQDDSVSTAAEIMRQAQVRRLPVIDAQGVLVGMVSLADLSREAARQEPLADKEITDQEITQTLAEICAPPTSQRTAAPVERSASAAQP
jgi:CBS domain-containing protein